MMLEVTEGLIALIIVLYMWTGKTVTMGLSDVYMLSYYCVAIKIKSHLKINYLESCKRSKGSWEEKGRAGSEREAGCWM